MYQGYKGLLSELVLELHLAEPFKAQVEAVFHSLNQESVEKRRAIQQELEDMARRYAMV